MATAETILLSRREAARLLSVTTRLIDRLARDGEIRPTRLGRRVLVARTELERYVRQQTATT